MAFDRRKSLPGVLGLGGRRPGSIRIEQHAQGPQLLLRQSAGTHADIDDSQRQAKKYLKKKKAGVPKQQAQEWEENLVSGIEEGIMNPWYPPADRLMF